MGYAYSDNGASFRAWNEPSNLLPGEVYFAAPATPTQLAAAFPSYGVVPLAQQAASALAAGLTISLSGSLTLSATLFPTDPTTTAKIIAMVAMAGQGVLPIGATDYPMKDSAGIWHHFIAAQYIKVGGAIASYASALDLIADGNPLGATALPSASVSLTV